MMETEWFYCKVGTEVWNTSIMQLSFRRQRCDFILMSSDVQAYLVTYAMNSVTVQILTAL